MKYQKLVCGLVFAAGATIAVSCGGRSLGNNSSDSGVTGTPGTVTNPSSDTTAPTVTTYTPANGSTPAPNTTLVSVTFSEPIDTATVTASSFHVKTGATCTGTEVSASAVVASNSNQTFTITLQSALVNSTQYSTCLTAAIKDVAGNNLVATQAAWTTTASADNTEPANVTGLSVQPGLTRLILTWTNPADADYAAVRILRKTTNDIGAWNDSTATVACGGEMAAPTTTCTDTGLTNGTTYYYKAFTRDAIPNYNATGANASGTPACGTIEDIRTTQATPTTSNSRYLLNNCTLPQVTVTAVHRDGSNMGFYIQQTQSGAGIFVFTGSVNPTTTLNLTPGDRITFAGGAWANLCVASFNRQLQIVKKTAGSVCDGSTTGYTSDPFVTADWTEGAANTGYLASLGSTISGNTTFSTDYVNGADGRLYIFTTTATITGAGDSSTFPISFGTSSTINIAKTALVTSMLANGIQFTPGRAVMGRFNDSLELRMYGSGSGGTTNYDGVTPGGGENGYAIKSLTYTTAPTISFFSPAANGGFNLNSTAVSVGFDQMMNTGTVTAASLKVVAGTDCAGAALANSGITNSNGQKTFTVTLTAVPLTDGNQYTTCVTTAVQNTSAIALASAQSATWRASSLTSSFATFESWDTANQPTGWTFGGVSGLTATSITQDSTTPHGGTRAANINGTLGGSNGNMLNTSGTVSAGACTRMAIWMRGTTTGKALSLQLQSTGGTNANYCNIGNDQLASSISAASVIAPANAGYTGTNINTGGTWMVAVCQVSGLASGAMNLINVRGGSSGVYNISFDDIEFLDSANNPCVPVDFTAPTVSSSTPASGATGIAFAPSASVTFDKAMNTTAVNGAYTVKETDCSGATVSTGTPTASGGNTVFTYALTNLKPSTTYAHCVTTGATSAAGTALASAFSASFTTGALTEPTGVSFTPGNTQVTIAFTVGNGNGGVQIVRGAAGASAPADCNSGTAVYNGSTSPQVETGLTNSQTYAYRVCTRHNAGAYLSAGVTGSATPIADTTPPTVSSTTPANAATGVATSSTVAVTFSEAMSTGTVTAQTSAGACSGSVQVSSDSFTNCIAMTAAAPTFSGGNTIATFTPASALATSTTYKIRVTTGVQDASSNSLATQFETAAGFTTAAGGAYSDLIISEYCEGNSNNKYIEIYNGTGSTVSLDNYRLGQHNNMAAAVGFTLNFTASTNLANNSTWVVCNSSIDASLTSLCNQTSGSVVNFNGDDAVVLQKNTGSWNTIDILGDNPGADTGAGWNIPAGTVCASCTAGSSTFDTILKRKSGITSPTTSPATSWGQWDAFSAAALANITANHGMGSR